MQNFKALRQALLTFLCQKPGSDRVKANLNHTWSILDACLKHTLSILEAYMKHFWSILEACLSHTWTKLEHEVYFRHTWSILEAYLKHTRNIPDPPLIPLTPLNILVTFRKSLLWTDGRMHARTEWHGLKLYSIIKYNLLITTPVPNIPYKMTQL